MIGIRFDKSRQFFDKAAVLGAVDEATRKNLSRGGAFIRQTAQRSMRTRKKASAPGQPPSAHPDRPRGALLKKRLFFAYEPSSRSVIVGPEALSGSKIEAPALHEYGGTVTRSVPRRSVPGRPAGPKQRAAFLRKLRARQIARSQARRITRQVHYPARPFMGPALQKEKPRLVGVWADSVH